MKTILTQYDEKIKGVFSFFDRIMITGYLMMFMSEPMQTNALLKLGVLYKNFKQIMMGITESIKIQVETMANKQNRPVIYLPFGSGSKEAIARKELEKNPIKEGLICVIKALETCKTAKVYGSDSGRLVLKQVSTKCLHYYLYFQDSEFGFMFVKIQTWFPFNIQIYINGRELMKHKLEKNGISYQCYDNSFTDLGDVEAAQKLADAFDSHKLCRQLDKFAHMVNPFLDTITKTLGQGYYWCVNQCEYATDVMFRDRESLEDIYPSLVGHAFHDLQCTDVFSFMGRKLCPQFQGEAVSDFKKRPVGWRVKFKLKSNSVKMYDKYSVLRVETTFNDPHEFKVFGEVHHRDGTTSKRWKPMGKSISNLYRFAEIGKAVNKRFLDAMNNIVPVTSTDTEIQKLCSRQTVQGKPLPALNPWSPEMIRLMQAVCDGRFLINGFQNKDIRKLLFDHDTESLKHRSKTRRLLKKLHLRGLIRKIPHSKRYMVSTKGHKIMGALIELRQQFFSLATV